jgi:hypothetical protein
MDNNIDVLGFKLTEAIKILKKLDISYDVVETKSFKEKSKDEGFALVSYVVKQEWTDDKKILLIVTTK